MDTRTGEIVYLTGEQAEQMQQQWLAWKTGALSEMPRFAPVDGDKLPVKPKRRKAKNARRSYKDFCR